MKIFLSGSVPKGDAEAKAFVDWRKEYTRILAESGHRVETIDPVVFCSLEGDSRAVVGAVANEIERCDIIIINAQERLGAGTSMEFVLAKYFKKPVIVVLPKDSHHRRSNLAFEGRVVDDWLHPFVDVFSDIILESPSELAAALQKLKDLPIKDITEVDQTIAYARTVITKSNKATRRNTHG